MAYYLKTARLLAALAITCPATAAMAGTPVGFLEYSSIVGAGQTVTISRLPTMDSTGGTHYYDVGVVFTINSDGSVSTTPHVTVNMSPPLQTDHFVAGNYTSETGNPVYVSGPGVNAGGQTAWGLSTKSGYCTLPTVATWFTGPISQNPYMQRLRAAKITSKDYAYGIVGIGSGCSGSEWWQKGALIGAQQTGGNMLVISSFTNGTTDQSTAGDVETFTLTP